VKAKRKQVDIRAIKKRFPAWAAHIDLFESIQDAVYSVGFSPPPKIEPEPLAQALSAGRTVLDACAISLDGRAFGAALRKLFKLLTRKNPEKFSSASHMPVPADLMNNYLCAKEEPLAHHATRLGVTPAELVSCCQQAARPQLVSLRETNSDADLGLWSQGYCPFCGALPAMAQIETRGVRYLLCPNCLARYRFLRHNCPACGHGGLDVLQMDAWPGLLLERCPQCEVYLKTWSDAAGPPPCPFPYLDILTRDVDEASGLQNLKRMSLSVMGV
jgi:FdhE protein